ncbi:MAG: succinylglutamate desuccinylase/aspartoacylase family protein [Verrucomicrobiota bacterium]
MPPSFSLEPLQGVLSQMRSLEERTGRVRCSEAGEFEEGGRLYSVPRIEFRDTASDDPLRIGIFGSIHGDEPVGAYALLEFFAELAQNDQDARGYEIIGYPVCNPTGFEKRIRLNHLGKDLNREFWRGSAIDEIRILEKEILARKFHGIISLHADDTSEGIYGFVQGAALYHDLLRPALKSAGQALPVNGAAEIDGFTAFDGLIQDCYPGILSTHPEVEIKPFELIFETPGQALLHRQIHATKLFLYSVLRNYRSFISYAQNL